MNNIFQNAKVKGLLCLHDVCYMRTNCRWIYKIYKKIWQRNEKSIKNIQATT